MERVARLLNDMAASGVIAGYAVFGAVAQMRYTDEISALAARFGLSPAWESFVERFDAR